MVGSSFWTLFLTRGIKEKNKLALVLYSLFSFQRLVYVYMRPSLRKTLGEYIPKVIVCQAKAILYEQFDYLYENMSFIALLARLNPIFSQEIH